MTEVLVADRAMSLRSVRVEGCPGLVALRSPVVAADVPRGALPASTGRTVSLRDCPNLGGPLTMPAGTVAVANCGVVSIEVL